MKRPALTARLFEQLLLVAGLCLVLKGGWDLARYAAFQCHPEWFITAHPSTGSSNVLDSSAPLPISFPSSSSLRSLENRVVLGRLDVPRLRMSVLVMEGDDGETLALAAGHLRDSAPFGTLGNAVVAGHRDTSFWPLRNIRKGDQIYVRSVKRYVYTVQDISIVNPEDVAVLRPTPDEKTLTIVTCYPFRYIGSAPKRFIVRAVMLRS